MPIFEAWDPLININLGIEEKPKMTKVSSLLVEEDRVRLVNLIKQYKDCFAWDNCEMYGFSRKLVEH